MRRFLILLPLLITSPVCACLNDRDSDSLATQAAQFPDTLRVITGRFERNPPLFYEMRIRRSLTELRTRPRDFGLYDDIAVAFDKLHRDDEALRIMEKKRSRLSPFDANNPQLKEAWYRYYANAGTFHAHRFMSQKTTNLAEMKLARGMIKRAMEIKPNAHFGREKYQLMAMDWILATKSKKTTKSLGTFLAERDKWESDHESALQSAPQRTRAIAGLSGLVVLGAAWQSVDVFEALSSALDTKDGVTLRHLALLRCEEILRDGAQPLSPKNLNPLTIQGSMKYAEVNNYEVGVNDANQKALAQLFPKLRGEAESWNTERQNYMLARLEKGAHPDIDSTFWADWKQSAPPSLKIDWVDGRKPSGGLIHSARGIAILGLGTCSSIFALWLAARWGMKRQHKAV